MTGKVDRYAKETGIKNIRDYYGMFCLWAIIGGIGAAFCAMLAGVMCLEFADYLRQHRRALVLVLSIVALVVVQAAYLKTLNI